MKIVIAGASGFIGKALISYLTERGHDVVSLVRREPKAHEIFWDPYKEQIDLATLKSCDAVINLAGENIASGYWSGAKKTRILESRVKSTRFLASAVASLDQKPDLLNASAVGYYGSRHEEQLLEDSKPGTGFLSTVCQEWEKATQMASDSGIRVVHLRISTVLDQSGGALAKMITPFKLGLGATFGKGNQMMAWIALADLAAAIEFILTQKSLSGAINLAAPDSATNKEFSEKLAKTLNRPILFSIPSSIVRLLFGEMGKELFLTSQNVFPQKLLNAGFQFQYPTLDSFFRTLHRD